MQTGILGRESGTAAATDTFRVYSYLLAERMQIDKYYRLRCHVHSGYTFLTGGTNLEQFSLACATCATEI